MVREGKKKRPRVSFIALLSLSFFLRQHRSAVFYDHTASRNEEARYPITNSCKRIKKSSFLFNNELTNSRTSSQWEMSIIKDQRRHANKKFRSHYESTNFNLKPIKGPVRSLSIFCVWIVLENASMVVKSRFLMRCLVHEIYAFENQKCLNLPWAVTTVTGCYGPYRLPFASVVFVGCSYRFCGPSCILWSRFGVFG